MSSREPVSLSDIDPQLAALDEANNAQADSVHDGSGQELEETTQDQENQGENENENTDANTSTKSKKKTKKKQGTVRGSTADYKRKEANRLAAERSRSRQAEKRANLVAADRRVTEEQRQLLDEIARLEGEACGGSGSGSGYTLHRHQANERNEGENAPSVDQRSTVEQMQNVGEQGSSGMTTTEAMDAEAEAQAHSRTILAALMSDAEINQALVGDWMDHDEQQHEDLHTATSNAVNAPAVVETPGQDQSSEQSQRQSSAVQQEEAGSSEAGKPGLAVSLHAEMERHLRDDLAATKIAIDQVEKELAVLRGEIPPAEGEQPIYVSPLPADITSTDTAKLDSLLASLEDEHNRLVTRLPTINDRVGSLMESRITEAERLKTLLLKLNIDEDDKAAVDKILRPLSNHLDDLLQSLSPERADALHAILGSRIAPAIAPRRRGRPPMHHPSTKQRGPRASRARKTRSRLSNAVSAGPTDTPDDSASGLEHEATESGTREIHPLPRNRRHADSSDQQGQSSQAAHAQPVVDLEMDHISDMQGEMTTEELISQLANHDDQDLRDLLTSHAESEYANQQAIAAHMQQQLDSQANPLDTPSHGLEHNQPSEHDANFKQGPRGSCDICSRTETTVWRKIRHGDQELHVCNPCGMYHIKTGKVRPPDLWGDGKLIRTRRKSAHPRKGDGKRFKSDEAGGSEGVDTGEEQLEHMGSGLGDDEGPVHNDEDVQMAVANLGEVDGHDEFRASLGMAGIGDIMRNFGEQVGDDVSQDVANVFGSVE